MSNPITTASNPRVGEDVGREEEIAALILTEVPGASDWPNIVEDVARQIAVKLASASSPAGGDLGAWIEDRLSCAQGYIDLCADNGTDNPYQKGRLSLLRELQVFLVPSTGSGKEETKGADWQPIETAPKDGTSFLATHEKSGVRQITWFGKASHVPLYGWAHGEEAEDIDLWSPTHWMPLPAPPPFPEAALRTLQAAGEVRRG